ncbi:hypothetical protein [Nocardiopsis sp. FIRDI 009]|uniref:hypothetical protein n=1 Tax=Nocardiopsis sp. FIRDI 009 TaxID=714197 RepID=UPI000E23BB53|nr:hypothetical protein [Nocardiopsis sp. FIRDI 009]
MKRKTMAGALFAGLVIPTLAFGAPSAATETDARTDGQAAVRQETVSARTTESAAPTDPRRCEEYRGDDPRRSCGGRTTAMAPLVITTASTV